jgi:hypothetical protein
LQGRLQRKLGVCRGLDRACLHDLQHDLRVQHVLEVELRVHHELGVQHELELELGVHHELRVQHVLELELGFDDGALSGIGCRSGAGDAIGGRSDTGCRSETADSDADANGCASRAPATPGPSRRVLELELWVQHDELGVQHVLELELRAQHGAELELGVRERSRLGERCAPREEPLPR